MELFSTIAFVVTMFLIVRIVVVSEFEAKLMQANPEKYKKLKEETLYFERLMLDVGKWTYRDFL